MTYETYANNGYFYLDYRKLSHWQRWRGIWKNWQIEKYRTVKIEFWICKRCGFSITQNFDCLSLYFIHIVWHYK